MHKEFGSVEVILAKYKNMVEVWEGKDAEVQATEPKSTIGSKTIEAQVALLLELQLEEAKRRNAEYAKSQGQQRAETFDDIARNTRLDLEGWSQEQGRHAEIMAEFKKLLEGYLEAQSLERAAHMAELKAMRGERYRRKEGLYAVQTIVRHTLELLGVLKEDFERLDKVMEAQNQGQ